MSIGKRWFNNFVAVCIVILFCAFLLVTAGCAGKGVRLDVETENSKCGTKNVKFTTDYQVEQLEIGRTIEGGGTDGAGSEGCGGGYTVSLGKGTTKDAEMGLILELVKMVAGMAGYSTGGTASPAQISAGGTDLIPPVSSDAIFKAGMDEGRREQTRKFNGSISGTQFKVDGAGNVWIDGKINPTLPLKNQ